jgi:hypothetical protein
MLKTQNVNVGSVGFSCPWCGKWHRVRLYEFRDVHPNDYGDVLIGPPGNRLTCKCGADLLVLGDPAGFDVLWVNEKDMLLKAWLKLKPKLKPGQGGYYDLIRVPHGHVPVTKVFLWCRLPLPVREIRGDTYFRCPECGSLSFFKVDICCRTCAFGLELNSPEEYFRARDRLFNRWQNRDRRDYFRNILKRLECLVLPLLVLLGKAWYVRSKRRKYPVDYQRDFLRGIL